MTNYEITSQETRIKIEASPLPLQGKSPLDLENRYAAYDLAAMILAHAFLVLCEEKPELLKGTGDPSKDSFNDALWNAFEERWPDGDRWLGGITGFQFGWAHNVVRGILGTAPVGNPAILQLVK